MYKARTAEEAKMHFGFPINYKVESFLSYGAWDDQKHINKLNTVLSELNLKHEFKQLNNFLSRLYEVNVDGKIYWFTLLYGGAMLSEYVHLACLFGSKRNIHIGSCGGLYPEMESLDFLIPEWSYGNDSVTRIYAREISDHKHFSDKGLSRALKNKITLANRIWTGPVMTCQAMMGETWEDVQSWSKDGFYGVEMETSTVFSVSNHYKVPCAALMYVSDNLIKGQTVGGESHASQKETRELSKNEVYRAGILALVGV
jgi:purine-nucleoside phosphorylase